MFVCPANILTFGLIKNQSEVFSLNAVIPATRRGVFCILNVIVKKSEQSDQCRNCICMVLKCLKEMLRLEDNQVTLYRLSQFRGRARCSAERDSRPEEEADQRVSDGGERVFQR